MKIYQKWYVVLAMICSLSLSLGAADLESGYAKEEFKITEIGQASIDALNQSPEPAWDKPYALNLTAIFFGMKTLTFYILQNACEPAHEEMILSCRSILGGAENVCSALGVGFLMGAYLSMKHIIETEEKVYDERRTLGLILESAYDLKNPQISDKSISRDRLIRFLNIFDSDYKATYPNITDHIDTLAEKLIYANEAGLFIDVNSVATSSDLPTSTLPLTDYCNLDVFFNADHGDYLDAEYLKKQANALRSYKRH